MLYLLLKMHGVESFVVKKNEKDAKIKVRQLIKSQKPYYFVGIYYEKHEIK